MNEEELLIFARYPELGKVKTRLAAGVGEAEALRIYQELLAHTHAAVRQLPAARTLWLAAAPPSGSAPLWPDTEQLVQPMQPDLGARMRHAFQGAFQRGGRRVVIIGTDCPGLQDAHLAQAFAHLHTHDVVLGPATDGGYYLLGMRELQAPLFDGIKWSTDSVLADTVATARRHGLRIALLPALQDIDTADDLAAWRREGGR